jgi:hypothetical protein
MRPGDHERIPTVSEAVRDGAALSDPDGSVPAVTALYEIYEDDDRPATAVEDLPGELLATVRGIEGDGADPAAEAAAAAAAWLGTNPGQEDADRVLREGVRLMFSGSPSAPLADWLEERGVQA